MAKELRKRNSLKLAVNSKDRRGRSRAAPQCWRRPDNGQPFVECNLPPKDFGFMVKLDVRAVRVALCGFYAVGVLGSMAARDPLLKGHTPARGFLSFVNKMGSSNLLS